MTQTVHFSNSRRRFINNFLSKCMNYHIRSLRKLESNQLTESRNLMILNGKELCIQSEVLEAFNHKMIKILFLKLAKENFCFKTNPLDFIHNFERNKVNKIN